MNTDETNRFRAAPDDANSTQTLIRQVQRRVEELIELLRSQQETLRKRGMNLPSGTLDNLRSMKMRLDMLSKQITGTQVELGMLRALASTSALIASTLDTDDVLNKVMDTVVQLTGAERGYIVLKNRETGRFDEFRVARGLDTAQLSETLGKSNENGAGTDSATTDGKQGGTDYVVSMSIVNGVAESGQPILTNNALTDERFQQKQSIVGFGLRSIIAVPLKLKSETIGVVYADNRILAGLFQQHELDLTAAFADQAAVAIENARLFEQVRAQLAEVTELRDLMDNIFDSIVSGVITTDSQGRVTKLNTASRAILGLSAEDDVTGHFLKDILPALDDHFYDQLNAVFSSGQATLIEAQPHTQQGRTLIWNVNASVLYELDGHNKGLALVIDDLTEQKRRDAQLAEVGRYLPRALVKNFRMVDRVDVGYEEREITAVFADVRGFTSFSEKLEPETLMRIINKYLTVASDAIDFWEGIVDKYLGDAVTGFFNTQLNPQHDHPVRAVQAALGIIFDVTNGLHDVLPEDQHLFYGIGIHTGMAVLGNIGSRERKEFGALGEATYICKVLQENAKGGEIIISPATYAHIEEDFDCEEVPLEKTKGFDLSVGYRVLRRKKGSRTTTNIFIDDELADLLRDN